MRRSKQAKQETHARIVEAATRRFRADGIAGTGIAEVMGEAGLTHGGFYAHFENKDALVAEACAEGLARARRRLIRAVRKAPADQRLAAFVRLYLSRYHRDHPATGCALPTLSAEIARSEPEVRAAFTQAYEDYRDELAALLPDRTDGTDKANADEAADAAMVLLAGMAGTMLLARAVDDPALSERMLRVNRAFYARAFAPPGAAGEAAKGEAVAPSRRADYQQS